MSEDVSKIIAVLLAAICFTVLTIISIFKLPPVEKIKPSPIAYVFIIIVLMFIYLNERQSLKEDDN